MLTSVIHCSNIYRYYTCWTRFSFSIFFLLGINVDMLDLIFVQHILSFGNQYRQLLSTDCLLLRFPRTSNWIFSVHKVQLVILKRMISPCQKITMLLQQEQLIGLMRLRTTYFLCVFQFMYLDILNTSQISPLTNKLIND